MKSHNVSTEKSTQTGQWLEGWTTLLATTNAGQTSAAGESSAESSRSTVKIMVEELNVL